jgi:ankyrin repeat protein
MTESAMAAKKSGSIGWIGALALLVLGGLIVYGVRQLAAGGGAGAAAVSPGRLGLAEAVAKDDPEGVRSAIKAGADVNAPMMSDKPGREGMTPLMHAALDGKAETLKALIDAKAKTDQRTEDGRTALMYAAGWGDTAKLKMLLDAGARTDARASDGWTALMWAAARGEPASVKALTAAGADVNAANKWRQTALMAAARTGSVEKVAMLLESGANATATDLNGESALCIAAANEAPAGVLQALVKAGAPVDGADADGVTPLMKAAERGDLDQVVALLQLGADVSRKDKPNGWTAKQWAAKRDDDRGRAVVKAIDEKK